MIVLKAVLCAAALLVAAALMGNNLKKEDESTLMSVVYGFIIEWAAAFFVATPLVLLEKPLSMVVKVLVPVYILFMATGLTKAFIKARRKREKTERKPLSVAEIVYLGLFLGIVFFELYKTVFYAYADGDDAFYVATARIAEASDKMYLLDAYIGVPNSIPYRYAFAPFPMWIAALARISGIDSATLSFSILSPVLVLVTFILYNEISKLLFGAENREKRYMFLVLAAVFEMFSNVSTSTSGTFMLTRARQGKETLACIILPLVFYELFKLVKEDGKVKATTFITLFAINSAAALSSLLGNVLVPVMLFGAGIWMLVSKKGFKNIVLLGLTAIVNVLTVFMYLFFGRGL